MSNMWMWLLSCDLCIRVLLLIWQRHRQRFTCKCWGSVLDRFRVLLPDIWLDLFGKSSKRGASGPAGTLQATAFVGLHMLQRELEVSQLPLLLLTWWLIPMASCCSVGIRNISRDAVSLVVMMVFSDTLLPLGRRRLRLVPLRSASVATVTQNTSHVRSSSRQHRGCTP